MYVSLEVMHRESKRPKPYNNYVVILCDIIDKEPSNYENDIEKKEWKDAMIKEYQSIMNNDGDSFETGKEVFLDFEVDLQDQSCYGWWHQETQRKIHGTMLLTERRYRLRGDICTHIKVHFH